ncbi:hypothetical protein [Paracoccus acridae]|uniref:hypothetical protein n=1 Tax=Paracoccus acridae TaxID=1795310 RepID=UPI001663A517|nr:hypothetical protein [Paracoccus acridae]
MPSPDVFSDRKSSSMMTTGKRNFIGLPFRTSSRLPVLSSDDLVVKDMRIAEHLIDNLCWQRTIHIECLKGASSRSASPVPSFDEHLAAAEGDAAALLGWIVAGGTTAGVAVERRLACGARWLDGLVALCQRRTGGLILLQILFHAFVFIGHLQLLSHFEKQLSQQSIVPPGGSEGSALVGNHDQLRWDEFIAAMS